MAEESLTLKWGTLKGWAGLGANDAAMAALRKYDEEPVSMGVMQQRDTPGQIEALCELVDAVRGPITNDWTGEQMTKDEAKAYLRKQVPA